MPDEIQQTRTVAQRARYGPGTKFRTRGKHPRECMVTDVLFTYDLAGALVAVRYVAVHEMAGQRVVDRNVVETTIAMGLISE